jgi:Na+-translocating ferredoxin:NAD+ oxidoreductase RnfD subunit
MSDDRFGQEEKEVVSGESELLRDLGKGALAGLIATIPVALIALIKQSAGLIPELDIIGILTGLTGISWNGTGWVLLFFVGILLGSAFAALDSHVSDATEAGEMLRGALFGFLLWILLMILFIPLYSNAGFGIPFAGGVLAACLIFGVMLGMIYERMKPEHLT